MDGMDILSDLLNQDDFALTTTDGVNGYITDGAYIDYVSIVPTKSGMLRMLGKALSLGYRQFAVYSGEDIMKGDNKYLSDTKLLEMDSQHIWLNSDIITE